MPDTGFGSPLGAVDGQVAIALGKHSPVDLTTVCLGMYSIGQMIATTIASSLGAIQITKATATDRATAMSILAAAARLSQLNLIIDKGESPHGYLSP